MKKAGLGIIALAIVGILYYLSLGSSPFTQELQKTVDQELKELQKEGFAVEERKVTQNSEHFVIVLDDTQKITDYFNQDRQQITQDQIASLQGMKIGVDIQYLPESSSALSFDLYPVTLPTSFTSGELTQEDRDTLKKIDALFKDKTFLVHIDVNQMLDGFKGFIKDIDQTFEENGQKAVLAMQSFIFSGDIKNNQISKIQQQLKVFSLHVDNELDMNVNDIHSTYLLHGATLYDTTATYSAGQITYDEANKSAISLGQLDIHAKTDFENGLAKSSIAAKIASIDVRDNNKQHTIESIDLESKVTNFDIQSFEQLKHIDTHNEAQINTIVQKILSTGLTFEIPHFSIKNIKSEQQILGGFDLSAKFNVDKSINLSLIKVNPMAGLASLDANLKLSLSDTLFTFISQQPNAMLAMMMFQPKEENSKKVYLIELKNGSLNVNGVPMM